MKKVLIVKFIGKPSAHLKQVYSTHPNIDFDQSLDFDILHIAKKRAFSRKLLGQIQSALNAQALVSFESLSDKQREQLMPYLLMRAQKGGHTIFKKIHAKKQLSTTFESDFEKEHHQIYFKAFLDHMTGIAHEPYQMINENQLEEQKPSLLLLCARKVNQLLRSWFPTPDLLLADGPAPSRKTEDRNLNTMHSHSNDCQFNAATHIVPSVSVQGATSTFWNSWTIDTTSERTSPLAQIKGEDLFLYYNRLTYSSAMDYPVRETANKSLNYQRNGYKVMHSGLACGLIDVFNGGCYDSIHEASGNNLVAGYSRPHQFGQSSIMLGIFNQNTYASHAPPSRSFTTHVSTFTNHTTLATYSPRYVSAIVTNIRGYLVNTNSGSRVAPQSATTLQQQFRVTTTFIPRVCPVQIVDGSGAVYGSTEQLVLHPKPYQVVAFGQLGFENYAKREIYKGKINAISQAGMQMGFVAAGSIQVAMSGKKSNNESVTIYARTLPNASSPQENNSINLSSGGAPSSYSYPTDTNHATSITTTQISDKTENIEFTSFTAGIDISATPYHSSASRSEIVSQNVSAQGPKYTTSFNAGNVGLPPAISALPATGSSQSGVRVEYKMDQYGTYTSSFGSNSNQIPFITDEPILNGIDMPLSTILSSPIGSATDLANDSATLEITTYLDNGTITQVPLIQDHGMIGSKGSPIVGVNKAIYTINTSLISVPPASNKVTSIDLGQPTSRTADVENILGYSVPARLAEMTINFADSISDSEALTVVFFVTDENGNKVDAVDIELYKRLYGSDRADYTTKQFSVGNKGIFPITFTTQDTGYLGPFEAFIEDERGHKSTTLYISSGSRSTTSRLLVTAIITDGSSERQSTTIAI
ncbi:MAG: hypothetical protein S4CHLAM102_05940 [Chlamydiia bacterium]|nr:hypothetical protein [Chlamydiia bacterium]